MRLPGSIAQGILARGSLVFLRVYLGVAFLGAAWARSAGLPRASMTSLVTAGEFLVGLTLLLGLLTRLSAAVALVLVGSSMLAEGDAIWQPWNGEVALAAIAAALLIGAAGRTMGLDALLAKRWPRSPFW